MKRDKDLDAHDKAILRFLLKSGGWHSTNNVATKTKISWKKAKNYLQQ